jgi:serine/threonine-protein kinase HipA
LFTELAKNIVERSVSVPGVQAKLAMSLIKELQDTSNTRLTVVGALGGGYIFKPPSEKYQEMPQNEHVTMRNPGGSFQFNTIGNRRTFLYYQTH